MTLIIAKKDNNDIFIVGDSRLTDMAGSPLSPLEGALKVQIINPNYCLAFAGTISEAFIKKYQGIIKEKTDISNDEILVELLTLHKEFNQSVDFIVASLKPYAKICQIKDGALSEDVQSVWIGSQDAFEEYQRNFYSDDRQNSIDEERYNVWIIKCPDHPKVNQELFSRMCGSMREVIHNSSINEVGDYLLPVTTTENGFNYMLYLDIDAPPLKLPKEGWNTVQFGSAAEGGHAVVVLTPIRSGIPSVGVHFLQGQFGAFFSPEHCFSPIVIRGVNCNEFAVKIRENYGIELYGPELN